MSRFSRREVLLAGGALAVGVAGGYGLGTQLGTGRTDDANIAVPRPFGWDDTDWPFPDYDPARTRHPPAESAPDTELDVAWRRDNPVDGGGRAPPVAANARLLLALEGNSDVHIPCFDLGRGTQAWNAEIRGGGGGNPERHQPDLAAVGGGVYYSVPRADREPFGLLSGATGEPVWRLPEVPSGPWLIGGGRVFTGDDDAVRGYDARTGDERWSRVVDVEGFSVGAFHPTYGLFAHSTVAKRLYRIDPVDGSLVWNVTLESHPTSRPIVTDDRLFLPLGGEDGRLEARDPTNGTRLWRYPDATNEGASTGDDPGPLYELAAATVDTVLVRSVRANPVPDELHAIDATTGERRWAIETPDGTATFSRGAVAGDQVFIGAGGEAFDFRVLRLALGDGTPIESVSGIGIGWGEVIVTDGTLVVHGQLETVALR
ncbi:MAG: outer membrane protein assembly factor BamB [Halobacteriales archaeon]|jgi:outer membrane protein assembly factor BamB